MHPDVSQREPARLSLVNGTSAGQPIPPPQALTMREALAMYVSIHLTTLKDAGPSRALIGHLSVFNDRTLDSLTVVELQQYFNTLHAKSPAAAHNTLKKLRHIYRKMFELQVYQGNNPTLYVKLKRPPDRSVFLNEQELSALFRVLSYYPPEDRLFFTALVTVFCRFGELRKAKVEALSFWIDRDTQQRRCLWRKGRTKNGHHHEVPLPPQLTEDFWTYLQTRRRKDSPWLFPGSGENPRTQLAWWSRWNEIRSEAGLDHVHIHDLRRTGSTWAVETTGDLNTVSRDGLQHADLKTTSIYVQSTGKKALQMFTAHEQALRAQQACSESDGTHVAQPHVPPGGSGKTAPIEELPQIEPSHEAMEWPG